MPSANVQPAAGDRWSAHQNLPAGTEPTQAPHSASRPPSLSPETAINTPESRGVHDNSHANGPPSPTTHPSRPPSVTSQRHLKPFHVFTFPSSESSRQAPTEQERTSSTRLPTLSLPNPSSGQHSGDSRFEQTVAQDLNEIDHFLRQDRSIPQKEKAIYQNCPEVSRDEVQRLLESQNPRDNAAAEAENPTQISITADEKVSLVSRAEVLFQFFLPPGFEGPTVSKYWGAVHQYLTVRRLNLY